MAQKFDNFRNHLLHTFTNFYILYKYAQEILRNDVLKDEKLIEIFEFFTYQVNYFFEVVEDFNLITLTEVEETLKKLPFENVSLLIDIDNDD